ncbi:carbohydrate-binding module family 1 protein [Xylaria bambusicola]|uniref:carbohydrate-binding module family 1 protein n=1 Tax=Xylaria bambusicola TaxID=326684 RepID=UPI002007B783|nr:carbohydrate-binding module family 1 protein [Xylaria bambusicola]KAI0502956.1 carbohydrate-binding module family 1 protein [Xylaria bambusicola]
MHSFRYSMLIASLAGAASVAAHGHITNIVINGVSYQTYDPTSFPYMQNPPTVVGWTANQPDNGFVEPSAYGNGDIICHKAGTPAGGFATVAAGDSISIQWDTWPESHKGPMMDYLAACNGDCSAVDKESLEFFKIDEAGILDSSSAPGRWASDVLIENNNSWLVQIPANLKAGQYVLRHETIALHSAGQANGAQNYPQCVNIEVTGSGTLVPAGVKGTELYASADAGITVNIYTSGLDYKIPGPPLIEGVPATVEQVRSAITASASATVGSGNGGGAVPTTALSSATTLVTSTRAATTTSPAETTVASTTAAQTATTTVSGGVAAQTLYGQCGGMNWDGPTACAEGTCTEYNPYYAQCVNA